jgi:hypothetical protein
LQNFFNGYNCTIMAYGNTCSGKSYTLGTLSECDYISSLENINKEDYQGIVPRIINAITQKIS